MKKIIHLTFVLGVGIIVLQSFGPSKLMKKDGAAPGFTGSPGDTLKNCTSCHGGTAKNASGWITSDIPSSGYVAGKTYSITTTNTEAEGTRFGFEISPQNNAGDLLGTIVITDTVQTKLVGFGKYITYTENGVDGNGFKTWSFKWIAPNSGTGNVTFYGAYNSNFNGHKDGDKTFLSSLTVKENGTTEIANLPNEVNAFSVYPNPATDNISIRLDLKETSNLIIDVTDITGKQVAIIMHEKQSGIVTKQYSTLPLPNGNYSVRLQMNGKTLTQKLTVNH
jgi:hypothetical protein